MVQAYSSDLRSRVIKAASSGMSARQAAERFGVGISTAIVWVRRYRQSGEAVARPQGKSRGSRLDPHAAFILGLVEGGTKDISLAEIAERLARDRNVTIGITAVWTFLDRHGPTFKKDRACGEAPASRHPRSAAVLVRQPARPRPRKADLHRRDRRFDQDGEAQGAVPAW